MSVVTRFPPSPTGYLHIGGARTALYSWLHARQHSGRFVLRIEDTDRERSTDEAVQVILDAMQWLGLDYDDGPYYQTQRLERYQSVIQQLLDNGHAYHCYCSKQELDAMRDAQRAQGLKPRYDGHCRARRDAEPGVKPVVRFKNPLDGQVRFDDLVKGSIAIDNRELDDLIIARSDGMPTYNLTVVVDDVDMGVTHVIRGDDHINNTPRQINIFDALGATLPAFGHVPMILGEDGKRMSKRHGAVGVLQYRDAGYLPDALLNYLVRLGWAHGDQEIFSREELLEHFRIGDVHRAPSAFNPEKLDWLNHEYIMRAEPAELIPHAESHYAAAGVDIAAQANAEAVIDLVRERCTTLVDLVTHSRFFFAPVEDYDPAALKRHIKPQTPDLVSMLLDRLKQLESWRAEAIHEAVQTVVDEQQVGFAKAAQPLRIAVSGGASSPSIDQTLALLGRDETLGRIEAALPVFAQRLAEVK